MCTPNIPAEVVRGRSKWGELSALETLPDNVLSNILDNLGYRSRMILAETSHTMRSKVGDPSTYGSIYEMHEFMEKMRFRRRKPGYDWPAGVFRWRQDLACFGCWRYKPQHKFTQTQVNITDQGGRDRAYARRCNNCLGKFYGWGVRTAEGQAALARWKRLVLCERCRCLRYGDEECEGCELRSEELKEKERKDAEKVRERERRKQGEHDGVVNVLMQEDPGVVDWLDVVGAADDWDDEVVGEARTEYIRPPTPEPEDNKRFVDWVAAFFRTGEETPESESTVDEGIFWAEGSQFLFERGGVVVPLGTMGREGSDVSALAGGEAAAGSSAGPSAESSTEASTASVVLDTGQNTGQDIQQDQDHTENNDEQHRELEERQHQRFITGGMTPAEQSLYLRIQAFVARHRNRDHQEDGDAEQHARPSRILELVAQKLRGLGMGMGLRMAGRQGVNVA